MLSHLKQRVQVYLLFARGRDRLETVKLIIKLIVRRKIPYSLGDAIDWKQALKLTLVNP